MFACIVFIVYGILGLIKPDKFMFIPSEFTNKPWSLEYKRKMSYSWILVGILLFILNVIVYYNNNLGTFSITLIAIVLTIPLLAYNYYLYKKYSKML